MKKLLLTFSLFAFVTVYSQDSQIQELPITTPVSIGQSYGEPVSNNALETAVSPDELGELLEKQNKIENISVRGTVTEVCPKKGCWVTLETENDEKFFVKMKDYGFFVSTDLKGKNIILNGNAEIKEVSVEELQHYAEDAGKSEEEIASITEPGKEIRFLASGILVVE